MSTETATPEIAEVDPRITKVTTAWKRVKKLEKELTDQQNCVDEQFNRLRQFITMSHQHDSLLAHQKMAP